jgi:hypothetical protein
MNRIWNSLRTRHAAWRRRRYMEALTVAGRAPYSAKVYRDFLSAAQRDPQLRIPAFLERPEADRRAMLFIRHDIDTAACIRGMRLLIDIDRELGISPGIYLMADTSEYRLADHRSEIEACRAAGFEVGLHTVCYTHDDYFEALRTETKVFADALGFWPRSFTIHGLGEHRLDIRLRFCNEILRRLDEFGFVFTDCSPELRVYDHVFHDCHRDPTGGSRVIYDELTGRRFPFANGKSYVLLTHPCYWKA